MSFQTISVVAVGGASLTCCGAVIYLSNNKKKDDDNPPQRFAPPQPSTAPKVVVVHTPNPKKNVLTSEQKSSGKIATVIQHDWNNKNAKTPYTLYECSQIAPQGKGNAGACTYNKNGTISEIYLSNFINSQRKPFHTFFHINSSSKLPIFYFDYSKTETYPDKPEDLDFKKLKQMTNTFKKLGKYILVFGNAEGKEYKKFCPQTQRNCQIHHNKNANDWTNISKDTNGKITINEMLQMQLTIDEKVDFLWWKPLLPLHENFVPDDYDATIKSFS